MTELLRRPRPLRFRDLPTTYAGLVALYAPRRIDNRAELERATRIIDAMAGHDLSRDQDDYLDLVSTLVSNYEEEHDPFETQPLAPLEALRCLMEENGMTPADLGRLLGGADLGNKILKGLRALDSNHIRTLADRFAVNPELFIPETIEKKPAKKTRVKPVWRGAAASLKP